MVIKVGIHDRADPEYVPITDGDTADVLVEGSSFVEVRRSSRSPTPRARIPGMVHPDSVPIQSYEARLPVGGHGGDRVHRARQILRNFRAAKARLRLAEQEYRLAMDAVTDLVRQG